jgi:hypothetical protein
MFVGVKAEVKEHKLVVIHSTENGLARKKLAPHDGFPS